MKDKSLLKHLVTLLILAFTAWGVCWAQDDFEDVDEDELTEEVSTDSESEVEDGYSTHRLSIFNPYSRFSYGNGLKNWLKGECNTAIYDNMAVNGIDAQEIEATKQQLGCNNHKDQFLWLGATLSLFTLLASLFIVLAYYVFIDKVTWNTYIHWGLFMLVNGVVGGLIALGMCYDATSSCWVYSYITELSTLTEAGSIELTPIIVANFLISMLWFVLMSGFFKRFSVNCCNKPWKTSEKFKFR